MERILHIQAITKDEFREIIENIVEDKISSHLRLQNLETITVEQAAIRLNLSTQSIRKKINNGTIPAKKIGRKYIIDSNQLESILKDVKSLKYLRNE
jgi:excisionase family DNA binding protein